MPDYKTMYYKLAAKMADAMETLDKVSDDLKAAQLEAEELYMDSDAERTAKRVLPVKAKPVK